MITFANWEFDNHCSADMGGDSSFGNRLFMIAGTIGIAVKNGYEYGFPEWNNERFFVNPLPRLKPGNYNQIFCDWGFNSFQVEDNTSLYGYFQSEKYFAHCKDLIRYYFTLKPICGPIKDAIIVHYRAYYADLYDTMFARLDRSYYWEAIRQFPDRRVVVVTDNIEKAKACIKRNYEYVSSSALNDFYILANADYLIMSNSTFGWWGSWLSGAKTVAPSKWFAEKHPESSKDIYRDNWIVI